ncbi:MAG: GAF domain-containing protein, partial [Anaerolineae bacterium]|nr:GAF domain-containing protein [Anaerolineae bacterium]
MTRILIVEDERIVALEIQRQLQDLGYEVVGIADFGESALDPTSERQPDLALMNIRLRGDSAGGETARLLLERLDIPVVYLTGSADDDALDRAKTTGPFGYLVKPLDARMLTSTVEMAVHRHDLERELRRSEARYRAVVEDQTELVFRSGPDLALTFVNDAFCRYFGAPREALLGLRLMLAIPEEEQPKLAAHIASLDRSGPTISLTHQVLRDGEVRWLVQTGRALFDANGTLMEYQCVARDVTERRQAEIAAKQQARVIAELNDITRAALASEKLTEVLQVLADRVGEIFEADGCSVSLWDEARNRVRPMATSTSLGDSFAEIVPLPGSPTMTDAALEAGHALAIGDVAASPFAWQREAHGFSEHAVLILPLMTSERKLGAAVVSFDRLQDFTDETIALGQQVSEHLSLAVAQACLLDESRSHWEASEALQQLTLDLATELDLDVLLRTVAERAMRLLKSTAAELHVYRTASDYLELRVALGDSVGVIGARRDRGVGLVGEVWETGKALVVNDYFQWEERVEASIAPLPACAVGVPIYWMEQFLGVLSLGNSHTVWTYTQADADSLQLFANHAATAIVNALLHHDLSVYAETLETHVRGRTAELQAIFDSAADGIIVADPQGNVLKANDIAQALLHTTLAPEEAGELRQAIRALAAHKTEVPEVLLALTGLDLEMRAAPISVGDSQSSVVITLHDITLLKAADRMKTAFITHMSHELRTPVSSLM